MERRLPPKKFAQMPAGGLRWVGRSLYNKHVTEKYDTAGVCAPK